MSLNDVKLSPQQLAQLYPQVLVETTDSSLTETTATSVPAPAAPVFHALGGNAKNILVVVHKEGDAFLPDSELTFLSSILAACKLNLADIALVNFGKLSEPDGAALVPYFNSRQVLLFHVEPLQFGLPINFPPFQIQPFNGVTYMHAPDLRLIEADKGLKKDLWTALKTLFAI